MTATVLFAIVVYRALRLFFFFIIMEVVFFKIGPIHEKTPKIRPYSGATLYKSTSNIFVK